MNFAKHCGLAVTGLVLSLGAGAAMGDVVAVVSIKNPTTSLTANQVVDIFLGRTSRFPNGAPAVPIDQAESSRARDEFYARFAGKSTAQMKAYWSKIIFTGRGQPPREAPNSAEVKKLLADNPQAIGYIEKSAVDGSVKVLLSE
ncbi:MAG TPA: phosphate ABC transporter substrate-binding protein [Burkholderiales bacterium]|nr:phosphate ABC transporter substrate-binding protein [Burkholderiales bacterium]